MFMKAMGCKFLFLQYPSFILVSGLCWPHELASIFRKGLLWIELCPPKRYVEVLTPGTSDCDLFGNQA